MDLSILIPARNEMFLAKTVENLLENIRADTEIIVVLDGQWADPPLDEHDRLRVIYQPKVIGQRAATNVAARMAKGRYLMKVDAHCAFDEGFDTKLIQAIQPDWTIVPIMKNLHAFDWVCDGCGWRKYQGPTPAHCPECKGQVRRDILWRPKSSPNSKSYCFDSEPHFQYFGEFSKRPEGKGSITETMSLQGSCFMLTREKYFELNICDEKFGPWGSQGIEVACKTWLSGGECRVIHNTWYAHMFRTQGGDFGFPYPLSGNQTERAKQRARELFFFNTWDKAIRPLSWLLEKFWPVRGWTEDDLKAQKERET